jgi:hypothetical protein
MTHFDKEQGASLLKLRDNVVANFTHEHWLELGAQLGALDIVRGHSRLLRSLAWKDSDYPGNAFQVLLAMIDREPENLGLVRDYVAQTFSEGELISSAEPKGRQIVFAPQVFEVPSGTANPNLVSVMMPFNAEFQHVYDTIVAAVHSAHLECQRADNMWEHSVLIQDVFTLIFRSTIVICDFTGRNPNVFYEAGIAHTLGKHVVPITQIKGDIPFDLSHHRFIEYLNNGEGRAELGDKLEARLKFLKYGDVADLL